MLSPCKLALLAISPMMGVLFSKKKYHSIWDTFMLDLISHVMFSQFVAEKPICSIA